MRSKFIFSSLLTLIILSQVIAQQPVEKRFTYEKYNLPVVKLDDFYSGRKYSVHVSFESSKEYGEWPDSTKNMVRQMLLESLRFPEMEKIETDHTKSEDFAKQLNEILVMVKFGQYSDRTVDDEQNTDGSKYRSIVKFKMPVTLEWYYRTSSDLNKRYILGDRLDENGYFVYESEFLPEQQHYANAYEIVTVANRSRFKAVADHLRSESDPYWPYTAEEEVVFTSMKKKKMDFSRLDQGCDTAGKAVTMISNEDIYANAEASAKLDEAIAIFEEVYIQYQDNSKVKAYPLLNILSCQLLQGNITGAYETVDRIKSMGGMFKMFVNTELVDKQKNLYDLHGVSYR